MSKYYTFILKYYVEPSDIFQSIVNLKTIFTDKSWVWITIEGDLTDISINSSVLGVCFGESLDRKSLTIMSHDTKIEVAAFYRDIIYKSSKKLANKLAKHDTSYTLTESLSKIGDLWEKNKKKIGYFKKPEKLWYPSLDVDDIYFFIFDAKL